MELSVEYKIILGLLAFLIFWMSMSFKNVFCEGRAGFGLCYNRACPTCPTCQTCAAPERVQASAPAAYRS